MPPTPNAAVPAWQQAALNAVVADLTARAIEHTRTQPGTRVYVELVALDTQAHVFAELRNKSQRSSGWSVVEQAVVLPGVLIFPDKATFLLALETAVTYKAEVRLVNGPIGCCLQKPAISVTGRFEGSF